MGSPAQKLGSQLKCFIQQRTATLVRTEKIVQDWIRRLWIGLMRSGGEQLHDHRNQCRKKLHNELGIQTSALPNFSDQLIQPILAEKFFNLLKTSTRLRQTRHGLLDRSRATGLLLLI